MPQSNERDRELRSKVAKDVRDAMELVEAHSSIEEHQPESWPATMTCKCGAVLSARNFAMMQHNFVVHIVLETMKLATPQPAGTEPELREVAIKARSLAASLFHGYVWNAMSPRERASVGAELGEIDAAIAAAPTPEEPGLRERMEELRDDLYNKYCWCIERANDTQGAVEQRFKGRGAGYSDAAAWMDAALSEQRGSAETEPDFGTAEEVISGLDAINKHNAEVAAAAPAPTRDFGPELREDIKNATDFALYIVSALGYRTIELEAELDAGKPFPSQQIINEVIGQLEEMKAQLAARPEAAPPAQSLDVKDLLAFSWSQLYKPLWEARTNMQAYLQEHAAPQPADRKRIIEECADIVQAHCEEIIENERHASNGIREVYAKLRALAAEKETR